MPSKTQYEELKQRHQELTEQLARVERERQKLINAVTITGLQVESMRRKMMLDRLSRMNCRTPKDD